MQWWSWILTAIGVFGLWLAGRKNKFGWAVGISAQTLWIVYALSTHQYGFLVSAFAYGWVYTKNFLSWRKEAKLNGVQAARPKLSEREEFTAG